MNISGAFFEGKVGITYDLRFLIKVKSYFPESIRVRKILNLDLSNDNFSGDKISDQEAKQIFFQTLALPVQSVCR